VLKMPLNSNRETSNCLTGLITTGTVQLAWGPLGFLKWNLCRPQAVPDACPTIVTFSLINLDNVVEQVWLCIGSETMNVVENTELLLSYVVALLWFMIARV